VSAIPDIAQIIAANVSNPWLYLPAAVLLGALHALEPGHSKSIMAAFVVATRGTVPQAALLGLSAAVGHTIVVWALVLLAQWIGSDFIEQQALPWLTLVSGLMIIAIAARLLWLQRPRKAHDHHGHHDHHDHEHGHHGAHDHDHHGHAHASPEDIASRYGGRAVQKWEIAWFGFTGGLLPCPSAIAVLLVALKLQVYALGVAMVAAFSAGLALTLVAIGVAAAVGAAGLSSSRSFDRWSKFIAPLSSLLVLVLGIGVTIHALVLLAG
jgi:nickel/cobalt exporter